MISIGSNRDNVTYGIKHYIVDTPEDLQKLSRTKKMGCTCFVIKSSKYYMLNSKKKWIEITPFGKTINSEGGDTPSEPDEPDINDDIIYDGGTV